MATGKPDRITGTEAHLVQSCERKRTFTTLVEAERNAHSLNHRNKRKRRGEHDRRKLDRLRPVHAYCCGYCGWWHMGRVRKDGTY